MGAERKKGPIVCHDLLINGIYDGGAAWLYSESGHRERQWNFMPPHGCAMMETPYHDWHLELAGLCRHIGKAHGIIAVWYF
ncbi:hypothetical protein ACOZ4Y_02915 [Komagataeibacter rhaeticus]|uniref:hypothetical protein n=1 Tax=Komagataeibacter rhaeticus TaxID=215221 RepID=UPI001427C2C3|nr:hypothetical protein [Komagataeibacter rhaeticus]